VIASLLAHVVHKIHDRHVTPVRLTEGVDVVKEAEVNKMLVLQAAVVIGLTNISIAEVIDPCTLGR
jgi:hypothetical protein